MTDMVFTVKARGKSEKVKKGNILTEYKVKLVSTDDAATLVLSDSNRGLFEKYPMDGHVAVKIGKSDQTTLPGAADDTEEEQ